MKQKLSFLTTNTQVRFSITRIMPFPLKALGNVCWYIVMILSMCLVIFLLLSIFLSYCSDLNFLLYLFSIFVPLLLSIISCHSCICVIIIHSVPHSFPFRVSLHSCSPVTYLCLCLYLSQLAPPSPRHLTHRVISCFWVSEIFFPFSFIKFSRYVTNLHTNYN